MNLIEKFSNELPPDKKKDIVVCKQNAKGNSQAFIVCLHRKGHDDIVLKYHDWMKKKQKVAPPGSRDYKDIEAVIKSQHYQDIVNKSKKKAPRHNLSNFSFKSFIKDKF